MPEHTHLNSRQISFLQVTQQMFRSLQAMAFGFVAAAFTVAPVAHAATTATYAWTDLQLSITDGQGQTTFIQGFETTGESPWQNTLSLLAGSSSNFNVEFAAQAPQPTLSSTTLNENLGAALGQVVLDTSVTNTLITQLLSLAETPLLGANGPQPYFLQGAIVPLFDHQYIESNGEYLGPTVVSGGIWVAPGSTVTLSGMSSANITLDPKDFDWTSGLAQGSLSARGYMSLGLFPDGADFFEPGSDFGPDDFVSIDGTEILDLSVSLQDQQAGFLRQEARNGFVSNSVTNHHSEGRWLQTFIHGLVMVDGRFGAQNSPPSTGGESLIPEPSTYALMGLGLVGVATAARRQRQRAGA